MLGFWGSGRIDYLSSFKNQKRELVYVSTAGSEGLKPLFVCGSFTVGIIAMISTVAERTLKHRSRLVEEKRNWEQFSSWITIVASFLGYINLFLVAIFDSRDHYKLHVVALVMFLGFLGISSFTIVMELCFLDPEYLYYRRLQISCFVRLLWSVLEVGLIVSFSVYSLSNIRSLGCLFEWIVAYLFGVHLILLIYVLCPHSSGDLLEVEECMGEAIEKAIFIMFGFVPWVKAYKQRGIDLRSKSMLMSRRNSIDYVLVEFEEDSKKKVKDVYLRSEKPEKGGKESGPRIVYANIGKVLLG